MSHPDYEFINELLKDQNFEDGIKRIVKMYKNPRFKQLFTSLIIVYLTYYLYNKV